MTNSIALIPHSISRLMKKEIREGVKKELLSEHFESGNEEYKAKLKERVEAKIAEIESDRDSRWKNSKVKFEGACPF